MFPVLSFLCRLRFLVKKWQEVDRKGAVMLGRAPRPGGSPAKPAGSPGARWLVEAGGFSAGSAHQLRWERCAGAEVEASDLRNRPRLLAAGPAPEQPCAENPPSQGDVPPSPAGRASGIWRGGGQTLDSWPPPATDGYWGPWAFRRVCSPTRCTWWSRFSFSLLQSPLLKARVGGAPHWLHKVTEGSPGVRSAQQGHNTSDQTNIFSRAF